MSDILFNPHNTSSKISRDVLNIIGAYVKHPLADLIKKEVRYGKNKILFNNKKFIYGEYCFSEYHEPQDFGCYRLDPYFSQPLSHDFPNVVHSNFEIYKNCDCYYLRNIIPMDRDTFYFMYRFYNKK